MCWFVLWSLFEVIVMLYNLIMIGFLWVLLLVLSVFLIFGGYFLFYWVEGKIYNIIVYLGVFCCCNFLVKRDDGFLVFEWVCGCYVSF